MRSPGHLPYGLVGADGVERVTEHGLFVAHVRGAGPDAREQGVLRDAFDAVRADDTVKEVR